MAQHGQVLSSQGNRAGGAFDQLGRQASALVEALGLATVRAKVRRAQPGLLHQPESL
jgi:hypothetical protein